MNKVISLLILLISINVTAQDWGSNNSKWIYSKFYDFEPQLYEVTTIETVGDTFVNGQSAYKMKITNNWACSNVNSEIYMYSTNDKEVYVKINEESEFEMIYDFKAEVGESWIFPIGCSSFCIDSLKYTVVNKDSILVNGEFRKRMICELDFNLNAYWYRTNTTKIIEGIGDVNYLFPWQFSICDKDYILGLRCYENNEIGVYQYNNQISCEIETSITEIKSRELNVYPNPLRDIINIDTELEILSYQMFSASKEVARGDVFFNQINITNIETGLYFLKLKNGLGEYITKRIMILK